MTLYIQKFDEIKNINSDKITDEEIKKILKLIIQLGIYKEYYLYRKSFCEKNDTNKIALKKELVKNNMEAIDKEVVKRILRELNNSNKAYDDSPTLLEIFIKDTINQVNALICFAINIYIVCQDNIEYIKSDEYIKKQLKNKKQDDIKFIESMLNKLDKKYEIDETKLLMNKEKESVQNELYN